jgi:hypothetical protein
VTSDSRNLEHLIARDDFEALPTASGTKLKFCLIESMPTLKVCIRNTPRVQEFDDTGFIGGLG